MTTRSLGTKRTSIIMLSVLCITYAFVCMTKNCFSSAMVFIVNEGLLTKLQTGTITAAFYVIYAPLQIVGGMLTDKWKPERFITVGLIGAAVSNLVIFFNQSYAVMLVSWCFNALVQFAIWPATFKLVSSVLVSDMRTNALFIVTFGNPCGVVISYLLAAIVGAHWQMSFLVSGIGLTVMALVWEITLHSVKGDMVYTEIAPAVGEKVEGGTRVSFLPLFFGSGLAVFTVISFVRTMFDLGIKAMAPTMINESYAEVTPVLSTVLSVVILIAGATGPCITRLIYPRFIKNEAVGATVFFGAALPLIAGTLLVGKISYYLLILLLALVVMLMSACSLFTTSYVASRFNTWGKGATAAGILNCMASLGVVAANTVFTGVAEGYGWGGTATLWVVMMAAALALTSITIPIWTRFLQKRCGVKTKGESSAIT